jgi:serine/threonine-protein kinase
MENAPSKAVPPPRGQGGRTPGAVEAGGAAEKDPLIGGLVAGRYRIFDTLGEGGMAMVYLAEDVERDRPCAVKVLDPSAVHDESIVERFLQEAVAASAIDHEHVIEVLDCGRSAEDHVYVVMEMLQGEDLADMLAREGRIPWSRARPMLLQICDALSVVHGKGIIHRDMKPENCFRIYRDGSEDFIKVLDFGIAKITGEQVEGARALTQTGMIFGTPEYMSPEQAMGRPADHRTDIYSLGVILFHLLTGDVPFRGATPMLTLVKHMVDEPPIPSIVAADAGITGALDDVILRCLQRDPEARYQSMDELAAALHRIDENGVILSAPPWEQSAVETPWEQESEEFRDYRPYGVDEDFGDVEDMLPSRAPGMVALALVFMVIAGAVAYIVLAT